MKKHRIDFLFAILWFLIILAPIPAHGQSRVPAAPTIGIDVGAMLGEALMGSFSLALSFERPISGSWSLEIEPSLYFTSNHGSTATQATIKVMPRLYPSMSHFFISIGAAAAWASVWSDKSLSAISVGPVVESGWHLPLGDRGLFIEPYAGYMALFGLKIPEAGPISPVRTNGPVAGFSLGWPF
jgi:hypothetical protein